MTKLAGALALLLAVSPGASSTARAEGYAAPEVPVAAFLAAGTGPGARPTGMAGAFTAVADDPSAVSWNPAGMTQLAGIEAEASLASPGLSQEPESGVTTYGLMSQTTSRDISLKRVVLDHASAAFPLTLGGFRLAAGIGYTRAPSFDLTTREGLWQWHPMILGGNPGSRETVTTSVTSGACDLLAIAGAAGTDRLSFGVSVNVWGNGLDQALESSTAERTEGWGYTDLEERRTTWSEQDLSGVNATFGFLARPWPKVSVGWAFRTPFTAEIEERLHVAGDVTRSSISEWRHDHYEDDASGTAKVDWPWGLSVGVSARPAGKLLVAFDYGRVNWSDAVIRRPAEVANLLQIPAATSYPFPGVQGDGEQYRLGGEYPFRAKGLALPVRAGLIVDNLMIRNELALPFDDSTDSFTVLYGDSVTLLGCALGAGVEWRNLRVDLGYVREAGSYSTVEPPPASWAGWCNPGLPVTHDIVFERLVVTAAFRM